MPGRKPSEHELIDALLLALPTSRLVSITNAANDEIARRQKTSEKTLRLGRPTGKPSKLEMRSEVAERLGILLEAGRKAAGMTQQQLAGVAGFSYKHLGELERGTADSTCTLFVKTAEAMGLRASDILKKAGY